MFKTPALSPPRDYLHVYKLCYESSSVSGVLALSSTQIFLDPTKQVRKQLNPSGKLLDLLYYSVCNPYFFCHTTLMHVEDRLISVCSCLSFVFGVGCGCMCVCVCVRVTYKSIFGSVKPLPVLWQHLCKSFCM